MSIYDCEKDDLSTYLNRDNDLLNQLHESIFPNIKHDRLYKEKLQINKTKLIEYVEFYKSSGVVGMFETDMELLEDDVKEISDKYGLYYSIDYLNNVYHFMFRKEND